MVWCSDLGLCSVVGGYQHFTVSMFREDLTLDNVMSQSHFQFHETFKSYLRRCSCLVL
jgi:hypothetical protein